MVRVRVAVSPTSSCFLLMAVLMLNWPTRPLYKDVLPSRGIGFTSRVIGSVCSIFGSVREKPNMESSKKGSLKNPRLRDCTTASQESFAGSISSVPSRVGKSACRTSVTMKVLPLMVVSYSFSFPSDSTRNPWNEGLSRLALAMRMLLKSLKVYTTCSFT